MPKMPTKLQAPNKLSPAAAKLRMLKRLHCGLKYEKEAWGTGAQLVAGVDEVGRGSLFGCVVAAAVILNPEVPIRGLRDSKLLLAERREVLAERIRERALAWAVAAVDAARIDQINIYQASRVAMREAVAKLQIIPDYLLIDAVRLDCDQPQRPIIHGDALSASIAAASILARAEFIRQIKAMSEKYAVDFPKGAAAHVDEDWNMEFWGRDELAMERLEKSAPTVKLTDEQKAQIAEIDSTCKARIAEKEKDWATAEREYRQMIEDGHGGSLTCEARPHSTPRTISVRAVPREADRSSDTEAVDGCLGSTVTV